MCVCGLTLSAQAQSLNAYIQYLHGAGCDDQSGVLAAQATGGVGNYSFAWSNGSSNDTITGIGAGLHVLTVYSGADSAVASYEMGLFGIDTVMVQHACNGGMGLIYLDNIDVAYPYQVYWENEQGDTLTENGAQLSGLEAGTFSFSLVDSEGCVDSGSVTIVESDPVLEATASDSVLCYGQMAQIWYTPGFLLYDNWGATYNSNTDTITYVNQMGGVNYYPQFGVDAYGCEAQLTSSLFVYQQGHPDPVPLYQFGDTISVSFGINPNLSTTHTYIWSYQGTILDTSNYSYLSIDSSGFYGVSIINQYGCSNFGSIQAYVTGIGADLGTGNFNIIVLSNPAANGEPWVIELPAETRSLDAHLTDIMGRSMGHYTLDQGRNSIGDGLSKGVFLLTVGNHSIRLIRN